MSFPVPLHPPVRGEPAWDIAQVYPAQGDWSEDDYFAIPGNRLVEYCDGFIEVQPMPTTLHQLISAFLYDLFRQFVRTRALGTVVYAPLSVMIRKGKYRQPDIVFMQAEHEDRMHENYWVRPDLVVEVVSPDANSQKRDHREKRADYARARISEYWIVDPQKGSITVLKLKGRTYVVHGKFGRGEKATSAQLAGFSVDVTAALRGK